MSNNQQLAKVIQIPAVSLEQKTTEELGEMLKAATRKTVEGIVEMAAVWSALVQRGVDMRPYQQGINAWLPFIAAGTLEPAALVSFAGHSRLLSRVAKLPREEQQRIVNDDSVLVWNEDAREPTTTSLRKLTPSQLAVVFSDNGEIRTPAEQSALISSRRKHARQKSTARNATLEFDVATSKLRIGSYQVDLSDVIEVLAEAHGPTSLVPEDTPKDQHHSVRVRFWPADYDKLTAHARRLKVNESVLVWLAARAYGLMRD